jgi:hypothetical protein
LICINAPPPARALIKARKTEEDMLSRIILATAMGCLPLGAASAARESGPYGIPVILQGTWNGANGCSFPTPDINIEIRDVSAQVEVNGPPLVDQELLVAWAGGTALPTGNGPSADVSGAVQGQQIWLPLTQTRTIQGSQTYSVHVTVLMFPAQGSNVSLGFNSGIGGQTTTFTNCQLADFQGFPF